MRQKKNTRTCVGCMKKYDKNDLKKFRIDKEKKEIVTEIDSTLQIGKGMYICENQECLKKLLKKRFLEKQLKRKLTEEEKEKLLKLVEKI